LRASLADRLSAGKRPPPPAAEADEIASSSLPATNAKRLRKGA
jgi:hypothetical protein